MNWFLSRVRKDGQTNPWVIALTVMLATFMEVLDTSVANVALPHIAGDLSAGVDESTWVLTSYLVSNAIVLPLTGWLSLALRPQALLHDLRGDVHRQLVPVRHRAQPRLAGLLPRSSRARAAGRCSPSRRPSWWRASRKNKQGMAMAVYGMGVVVAPIIGPTLGGWITDDYSWRWIFFINIPVGILSLLMTSLLIHDPPYLVRRQLKGLKIDYIGPRPAGRRAGLPPDRARQGPARGLVQLQLHRLVLGSRRRGLGGSLLWELRHEGSHRRLPHAQGAQLRHRHLHDVHAGLRPLRQHGAPPDLPADLDGLHGDAERAGALPGRIGDAVGAAHCWPVDPKG